MSSPGARRGEQLFGEDRRDDPSPPLDWSSPTKVRQVKEASHRAINAQRRGGGGSDRALHCSTPREAQADRRREARGTDVEGVGSPLQRAREAAD
jgi:hypothetical protein